MTGSGTSLVVARSLGHEAIGFDTDPLAVLLARTWCSDVDPQSLGLMAVRVLEDARRRFADIPLRDAYPHRATEETKAFVRYWFDETNRRQLAALAAAIREMPLSRSARGILWCAFSRLIITKQASASRAMDLAHSRPHRVDARVPIRPFKHFLSAVTAVLKAAPFSRPDEARPAVSVRRGDARHLPLPNSCIDVVITSPPYLNAIDYLRGHKFSLVWMGYSVDALREVRASNIGTEAGGGADADGTNLEAALRSMGKVDALAPRFRSMLVRYLEDMDRTMKEVARVLAPGGRAILVVGDCTMRDVYVSNSRGIAALGQRHRLELDRATRRRLPANRRYLPPPSSRGDGHLHKRMRTEVILRMTKAG
jgi:hypothetical protein